MCGIVGYTGPREAGPILIEGLKRLEYRGYDSAGIALVDDAGDLFVEKRAGKLVNLQTAIADRTPHAAIGLAHTRWATHGRPNDLNAHPHRDCTGKITVIHNGIIENFRELRDGLEARGHNLTSETDTEAIAHLIEEAYDGDIAEADDERHVLAGADEPVALGDVHDGDSVGTLELAQGGPDRVGEVAVVRLLDQVGDRLGVGLGGERVTAGFEPVAQLAEVLDDPVVDDRDPAGAVAMRVRVEVVRPAMGRPPSVGEAEGGVRRPVGDRRLEVDQLAGPLLDEEVPGVVDQGDARRIVAAILEPLEPLDEDGARLSRTRVADDAAHQVKSSVHVGERRSVGSGGSDRWAPRLV